jgi:hypothetical protein
VTLLLYIKLKFSTTNDTKELGKAPGVILNRKKKETYSGRSGGLRRKKYHEKEMVVRQSSPNTKMAY